MSQKPTLCTTSELAAALAVDASTIRKWVAQGTIRPAFTTPGGHHRFDLAEVRRKLAEAAA